MAGGVQLVHTLVLGKSFHSHGPSWTVGAFAVSLVKYFERGPSDMPLILSDQTHVQHTSASQTSVFDVKKEKFI